VRQNPRVHFIGLDLRRGDDLGAHRVADHDALTERTEDIDHSPGIGARLQGEGTILIQVMLRKACERLGGEVETQHVQLNTVRIEHARLHNSLVHIQADKSHMLSPVRETQPLGAFEP
jgi:hypothetical protein